jgi:hypothetical protein
MSKNIILLFLQVSLYFKETFLKKLILMKKCNIIGIIFYKFNTSELIFKFGLSQYYIKAYNIFLNPITQCNKYSLEIIID